jgi:outer membrane lipoprotein-sorting protein
MKTVTKFFLLIIPFLLLSCNSNKSTLEALIKKINQAQGNAENIKSIIDQRQEWNMADSKGNNFKCIYLYKRPDKLKMQVIIPQQEPIIMLYNGGKGKISFFGQTRDMSSVELHQYEMYASTWLDGFQNYNSKDGYAELLDDKEIDGVKYHVIHVKDKYKHEAKLFVTENGDIEISESSQVNFMTKKNESIRAINKKFKNFNGINMATEKITIDAVNNKIVMNLEKVESNIGLTAEEFKIK